MTQILKQKWTYLVDAHRCKRLDEPKNRRLCRRSRLRGVGKEALRRLFERGIIILSCGFPKRKRMKIETSVRLLSITKPTPANNIR